MLAEMESGRRKHSRWQTHCNFLKLVCPAPHHPEAHVPQSSRRSEQQQLFASSKCDQRQEGAGPVLSS